MKLDDIETKIVGDMMNADPHLFMLDMNVMHDFALRLIAELAKQEPDVTIVHTERFGDLVDPNGDGWTECPRTPLHNLAKFLEEAK